MATLKTIAEKLNVSVATVSRVLNRDESLKVRDETARAIFECARAIGYIPKKRKHPKAIGLVSWLPKDTELEDPYFMEIRHGIEARAAEENITLKTVHKSASGYPLERLSSVEGVVALGRFSKAEVDQLKTVAPAIVFVDTVIDTAFYDSVVIDYEAAMQSVLALAKRQGYESLGFIGGKESQQGTEYDEPRFMYYQTLMQHANLYDEKHVHIGAFSIESGYHAMQMLLQDSPARAYFCASDMIAMGALKALSEAHIKVPKTIALIGFNDVAQSAYLNPALTTVKVYTESMGREAVDALLRRLENPTRLPIMHVLPCHLIERDST